MYIRDILFGVFVFGLHEISCLRRRIFVFAQTRFCVTEDEIQHEISYFQGRNLLFAWTKFHISKQEILSAQTRNVVFKIRKAQNKLAK